MVKIEVGKINSEYRTFAEAVEGIPDMLIPGKDLRIIGEDGSTVRLFYRWYTNEDAAAFSAEEMQTAVRADSRAGFWLRTEFGGEGA